MANPTAPTPAKLLAARCWAFDSATGPAWWAMWWVLFYALSQCCDLLLKAYVFRSGLPEYVGVPGKFSFVVNQQVITWTTGMLWFLCWQFTLRTNYALLGIQGLRYTAWDGVLWWFVPIANLFMPYLILRELWKAGTPANPDNDDPMAWRQRPVSPLLLSYWVHVLLVIFLGMASIIAGAPDKNGPGESTTADGIDSMAIRLGMMTQAVCIAKCLIEVAIISRLTQRQEALRARMA